MSDDEQLEVALLRVAENVAKHLRGDGREWKRRLIL